MEEDSTTGRRSSVATVATMLSINSTNSTISTMDIVNTIKGLNIIHSKTINSGHAKEEEDGDDLSIPELPGRVRGPTGYVPGTSGEGARAGVPTGARSDIIETWVYKRHSFRANRCGPREVGEEDEKRHAGVLTTGGDEKRSANENDKLEADGDRVLERDKEREREKEHDQDLKTHPRDVDALLAKIMAAGYERRTTFPNVANPVLWAEVGRNVDWLEGMPAAAVLELGVEIFNARIEFLRRAKIAERDEKRAMRRRRLRDGTDGEERKEGGDSGVEVGTACQPPTPSLSPTSTRRSISSSQCSINPSKITGRTARIVDAWTKANYDVDGTNHQGYDDELYAPVSKEPREGYRADDEYVEDPLQYQNWWWKGNKKVRRKMKPIASGNGSKAEGRKTPAKK
ncbi:hypothetical protein MKZ38_006660 [Zalerion maritima]|uniref:Uncharacterized protein n=1 Tax=Zalerion maritima TaxID=339359 RepID=A0AAD5RVD4_9PEZI|nr:hypothetical protein MKZ38_006660 [Zalerion maritima]